MTTLLFIVSLFVSVYLVDKHSKKEEQFFESISERDSDTISSYGIDSDNAFKAHLARMKYFKGKAYEKLGDESINLQVKELTTLNRLSGVVVVTSVCLGVFLFFFGS